MGFIVSTTADIAADQAIQSAYRLASNYTGELTISRDLTRNHMRYTLCLPTRYRPCRVQYHVHHPTYDLEYSGILDTRYLAIFASKNNERHVDREW